MITNLHDLLVALNEQWLREPLNSREETEVRVYLDGVYVIEKIDLDEEDGTIVLWLDERGDQES